MPTLAALSSVSFWRRVTFMVRSPGIDSPWERRDRRCGL
jgi:hypothetical protein